MKYCTCTHNEYYLYWMCCNYYVAFLDKKPSVHARMATHHFEGKGIEVLLTPMNSIDGVSTWSSRCSCMVLTASGAIKMEKKAMHVGTVVEVGELSVGDEDIKIEQ